MKKKIVLEKLAKVNEDHSCSVYMGEESGSFFEMLKSNGYKKVKVETFDEFNGPFYEKGFLPKEKEKTYKEKRAEAYPSVIEQLDLIYHKGIEGWKEVIEETKKQFPKRKRRIG